MTVNIKTQKYQRIIWWLFCFCATGLFGLKNWIPIINQLYTTDSLYIILFVFAILLIFYNLIRTKSIYINSKMFKLHLFFFFLILIELLISIKTYVPLGQSVMQTFKESFYHLTALLLCFAFMQNRNNDLKCMSDIVIKSSIICGIIASIEFISYQTIGLDILKLGSAYDINTRNGSIRFGVGGNIVYFAAIFSFANILNKKGKMIDGINLFLFFVQLVVFSKTRMMILSFIILFGLMLLSAKKIDIGFRLIGIFSIIFVILFAFLKFDSIYFSISSYFEDDAGIMIRFKTIEYYWKQILEKPFFGFGFITANRQTVTYSIMSGDGGYYFRNDVGIIGFLDQFGFMGGIWYLMFLFFMLKFGFNGKEINNKRILWIGIFFIITMPTLILVSHDSINSIVIPTVIIDTLAKVEKNKKKEVNLNYQRKNYDFYVERNF